MRSTGASVSLNLQSCGISVDEAMEKVRAWPDKLTDEQYNTLCQTVTRRLGREVQTKPAMALDEQKRLAKQFACAGASSYVRKAKEQEREAEREALPTERQMMNLLGQRGLPQEGPAATIANQVHRANQMQLEEREERRLMCAKDLRLQELSGAYDLFPKSRKPGLILTRDPNNRGATNMAVFEREKQCLVRLGATDASADRFLIATAAELCRQLAQGMNSGDDSDDE